MDGVLLQSAEALGDSPFVGSAGEMWELLQAEKEEVEHDILFDGPLVREAAGGPQESEPAIEVEVEIEWRHRENLEERLRALNDAQDRLIDGGYGLCLECGKQIDTRRLVADPAASLCLSCQALSEKESPAGKL
jgi:RNA polymerase-binding transcription factor